MICLAAMLGFAGPIDLAHAAGTITVNSTAQRGAGTSAVCTLGAAIISANTNGNTDGCTISGVATAPYTINVPAGTYSLGSVDNNGSFGLPFGLPGIQNDITINGASAATTIIVRSSANGTPNFAFFDNRQNSGHLTLNDLTLRNGSQASSSGAILNIGGPTSGGPAALTVNRCIFDSNAATVNGNGGAIGGGGTIADSTFTNNTAAASGGAISGEAIVSNSFFSGNTAGTGGGALFCAQGGCGVQVTDSTFANNSTATGGGGAIVAGPGSSFATLIARSVFSGNSANDVNSSGGALSLSGGTIADSLFQNNSVNGSNGSGGGAISENGVAIVNSTFLGNRSNGSGGALLAGSSGINNSTFWGNTAALDGGAIQSGNGLGLNNVTMSQNSATNGAGGGIAGGSGDLIWNSILALNYHGGTFSDCSGTLASQGHNIIGVSGCSITPAAGDQIGTSAAPIDPVLGNPGANSGKTAGSTGHTSIITTQAALLGSPALDAGDPGSPGSGGTSCGATDERGVARPVGTGCDIGAFEAPSGGAISTYDLSVTNTASPNPVTVNTNLTYTVVVHNPVASDTATGVSLSDSITPSTFVSLVTSLGWSCSTPAVGATGNVTCTRPTIPSDDDPSITLTVKPTAIGSLSNTGSITSTGNDTNSANNSATATVNVVGQATDLSLTKSGAPNPVNVGSNLTYTLTATNNGPGGATNVLITDVLPLTVSFVSANSSQGSCSQANGTVTCNLGSLANGANATATIVVKPQAIAAPSVTNAASLTATEPDPTPANNSASVTTTVNPVADLAVTKTASANSVQVGTNLTYTIIVTNNGPSPANGVTLTDTLPPAAAFVFVSANASQGSCVPPASGKIVCTAGTLASGASATATVVITPTAGAVPSITNSVSVISNQTDPNSNNNSASVTTAVTAITAQPDFTLAASPLNTTVQAGGTGTYTLTVTPAAGFTGNVSLACSGAPALTTCSISPNPVSVGATAVNATMTLQTSAPVTTAAITPPGEWRGRSDFLGKAGLVSLLGMMVSVVFAGKASRRKKMLLPAFATLILLLIFLTGCGGKALQPSKTGGTPAGTYQITVTATSGQLSHSASVVLTVQ